MFGVLSTFLSTILNVKVCFGEAEAGRGPSFVLDLTYGNVVSISVEVAGKLVSISEVDGKLVSIFRLKNGKLFSSSERAFFTKGKLLSKGNVVSTSEVDLRTGKCDGSAFLGWHLSKTGLAAELTVSDIWRVKTACLAESDLERGASCSVVCLRRTG